MQNESRETQQAKQLEKEQERKKAYLAREQAIERASQSKHVERAEKRVAEDALQLARDDARKKAYFAREAAMSEARAEKKLKDSKKPAV
jgi:hypothetical protein